MLRSGVLMGVAKVSRYTSFFARPFFFAIPLRLLPPLATTSFTLLTLLTLSVRLYAVLVVYAYNPMEHTHNTFILAWLMQLTSAYALVEVYPAL